MTESMKLLSQESFADLDKIFWVQWAPFAPELCSVAARQDVCHLWPFKSETDLHLAMAPSNKLMGLLAQLHHPTVRLSASFANPLSKSISDSCRNIALLSEWSLTKMFDIKGQILDLTLLFLCSFICFFNGRYSQEYTYEVWNWPGKNIPPSF